MKNHLSKTSLLSLVAALLMLPMLARPDGQEPPNAGPLDISLSAVDGGDAVSFSLTNTGQQTLSVLLWDTPLEPQLSSDVFSVGNAVYKGRHIKRAAPLASDYIVLDPGQSVSTTVALNQYYDIQSHSDYQVSYNGEISYSVVNDKRSAFTQTGQLQSQIMASDEIDLTLAPSVPPPALRAADFQSCSVAQQDEINQALDAAEQITMTARDDLANLAIELRASSPRYINWFGRYTAARYADVQSVYDNTLDVMANQVIEFSCNCNESAFAFVFTNDPFKIFLCNAFWTAAVTGTDSRAGTIVHELSHFPDIKGTEDHAYGQIDAAALARSNPELAVNNADSIEYFAENTPALPILDDGSVPAVSFAILPPGTTTSGTVVANGTMLFESNAASRITLTSNSGDADLYVYSDRARTNELCRSILTTAVDSCDFSPEQQVFIMVAGFTDANFSLESTGTPVVTTQTGDDNDTDDTADGSDNSDSGGNTDTGDTASDTGSGSSDSGGSGGGGAWFGLLALLMLRRQHQRPH